MAATKLSDVIVPEVYGPYIREQSNKATRVVSSGIVYMNDQNRNMMAQGGTTFNNLSWKHIADAADRGNVPTDDPTDTASVSAVTGRRQITVRVERNKVWGSADLVASLAGDDPLNSVSAQIGEYNAKERQITLLLGLGAVFGTGGPLNATVSGDGSAVWSSDLYIDAKQQAWGHFGENEAVMLVIHSKIYAKLQKQNLITFQPTNAQDIGFGTYLGATILVDDQTTVGAVGSPLALDEGAYPKAVNSPENSYYISYICRGGSISFSTVPAKVPLEINREPLQANGGGVEYIVTRDVYAFHVDGLSFTGTPAGTLATDGEIGNPSNYALVWDRKRVGVQAVLSRAE